MFAKKGVKAMEHLTIFVDSINKIYDSIVWTHKIQRTYLEFLEKRRKLFEILKIIFTASAAISTAICAVFKNEIGTIISSFITVFSTIFTEILDKVETKKDIQSFKDSSTKLWEMRNEIIVLKDKINAGKVDDSVIEAKIESLNERFSLTQRNLPTIPDKFVDLASFKLKERKDEERTYQAL